MKVNPGTDIGKRLWEFLKAHPMSVIELAEKIGVSGPTITRLLETDTEPRVTVLLKIEKFIKDNDGV